MRFSVRFLLELTLFVAVNAWYLSAHEDYVLDLSFGVGVLLALSRKPDSYRRLPIYCGIGGSVGMVVLAPAALWVRLSEERLTLTGLRILELLGYVGTSMAIIAVAGFVFGAGIGVLLWPVRFIVSKYKGIVDQFHRDISKSS